MTQSKYETCILPRLEEIRSWSAEGVELAEIGARLGVSQGTLRRYADRYEKGDGRYGALAAALEGGDLWADEVERALLERAKGIEYTEVKVKESLNYKTGEVETLTTRTTKYIPPDPASAKFWLTNRRPERWKSKPEELEEQEEECGVIELAPVGDLPDPPPEEEEAEE